MFSIGEIIDKLIIENIKISTIKERIHGSLDDNEYTKDYEKMMTLNENRSTLYSLLDERIEQVMSHKQKNRILKVVKTYGQT